LVWKLDIYNSSNIYGRLVNSFKQERMIYLKLDLEFIRKVQKQKRHCFLKSYGFHSLQEILNAIENLCRNLWLTYLTRILYQIRRIKWSKINSYITKHQACVQQGFFNNYFSWIFFNIICGKEWKIILDYCFIYFYYFKSNFNYFGFYLNWVHAWPINFKVYT
jgi:hypothetical protein